MNRWRAVWLFITAMLVLCVTACGEQKSASVEQEAIPANAFRILAGSELKDIEQQFKSQIEQAMGVPVSFTYSGTLDAIDRIAAGEPFDAVWVSHGKYLAMSDVLKTRILAQEKTMLSPVVLGIKASKANALGWDTQEPTWKEIADAAEAGRFSFGMTNPTSSNSGFTAIIGLASALAQTPDALSENDAKNPRLQAFFKGQRLTSGSSGWLAEAYTRNPDQVDGIINYESVLLSLNRDGQLREPLTLVYPKEGIITADYPLMLINADKRTQYERLIGLLRSPAFQTQMSATTLRRPVLLEATAAAAIPKRTLIELPFPGDAHVIDLLLTGFLSDIRIPASSRYVLDLSGSMDGDRLHALKQAMAVLDGSAGNPSRAARFAQFQNRESVGILTFSSEPQTTRVFQMGNDDAASRLIKQQVADFIAPLQAGGGTAIYDSVQRALQELAQEKRAANNERYYSVVLMTDGENTAGMDYRDFQAWYLTQSDDVRAIKVFPIIFGDADSGEMKQLAALTNGRDFDARKASLTVVFKDIRGYQ